MGTQFVSQAEGMNTNVGTFKIPDASLSVFDTISVILWVPIYDKIIVPTARKFTGHKTGLTHLQRIGLGLLISISAMVSAAVLEMVRLSMAKRHNLYDIKEVPISVFWQIPQYFIIGCAEVFTFIGQLELFYDQAPDSMRSLCTALSLTTAAIGNYLSSFLVTIVTDISTRNGKPGWLASNLNRGHLDYFFWLLAALSVINLGVFVVVAKMYTYKKAINKDSGLVDAENGNLDRNL
nr:protein NRT1/ PTR FAMILY 8.1-like [Ipomoea batatas]